ncbi:MAG: aldehyde dehydrogenase family protein [Bacteroidales bacterium]|nr:aldehyde dehydrogenase family protein [Bacteroidales bacterium]
MPEILTVRSPYNGRVIRELPLAGEAEIENALQRVSAVLGTPSRWLPKYHRIEILDRLSRLMESQVEALTLMAAEEGGKPYQDSKVEVLRAINGVKIAIAELYNLRGEEIPMGMTAASVNRMAFTTREPIGVVLAISAFNHPLNLIVHQVIPAVAAGCPVIVKPASSTPVSCFNLVRLLHEAGLPEDHCIPLVCSRQLAEKMAADPRIAYLTFIGSHAVGWHLRSILAPGTRVALEHGGVAPVIIDKTSDIEEITPGIAKGGFYHAGQVCVSVQRVFVHESIARPFAQKLAQIADTLKVGDPLDPTTDIGPMITPEEVQRVQLWVDEAVAGGAEILTNENSKFQIPSASWRTKQTQNSKLKTQNFFRPTVLFNPPPNALVSTREVFGPVICVYRYSDLADAIAQANSLRFAFQAAVFTKDIDTALSVAKKLNASAVMINDHTAFRVDWMPFGGRDESGVGTGGIPYTMREMTREKLIVMRSEALE